MNTGSSAPNPSALVMNSLSKAGSASILAVLAVSMGKTVPGRGIVLRLPLAWQKGGQPTVHDLQLLA
jgi:hypothetical protein